MKKLTFITVGVLIGTVLAIATLALSCNSDSEAPKSGTIERVVVNNSLLETDFSDQIASLSSVGRDSEDKIWLGYPALYAKASGPEDESILSGHKFGSKGYIWNRTAVLTPLSRFMAQHKRLPANGTELFPELSTPEGIAAFETMQPNLRLEKYHEGINPYTGKFYRSFAYPANHEPGGYRIELLDRDGATWEHSDGKKISFSDDGVTKGTEDGAFSFFLLGSKEGSILYQDYCTYCLSCSPPPTGTSKK